eukprot:snap_masked-scaffold_42-processed-gene-1.20-mRNA-1 protein AED:1.00 eAED:1.00 QI:0/-1/0/0/-1/1/1/0/403
MSEKHPILQLHFDVNGTIIVQDLNNGKGDIEEVFKQNLGKTCLGKVVDEEFVWNGDTKWENWEEELLSGHPEQSELISYKSFVSKYLGYLSNKQKRKQYSDFFDRVLAQELGELLDTLKEKTFSNLPEDSYSEYLKHHYHIIPSFFLLLTHLIESNRRFNIVIRTFGAETRINLLKQEINDFFSHNHAAFKLNSEEPHHHRLMNEMDLALCVRTNLDHDVVVSFGNIERPPNDFQWGNEIHKKLNSTNKRQSFVEKYDDMLKLRSEKCHEFLQNTVEELIVGKEDFYNKLKEESLKGKNLIIREDFPWWKANNYNSSCGKSLLVNSSEITEIHPVIFDDNVKSGERDNHIIQVYDIHKKRELSFEETHKLNVFPVNTLLAVFDEQYFIKAVETCEQNRRQITG